MSWMRFCDLCLVSTRVDVLEQVDVFPLAWVCPPCRAELLADEEDPTSGDRNEPECSCRGDCRSCVAVRGWL